ncbi:MAG: imelysin family protein [Myxococcota bacterium]
MGLVKTTWIAAWAAAGTVGCGTPEVGFDKAAMLRATVDGVILPTNDALAASADALDAAVVAFCVDRTAANLDVARTAWLATKVPAKQIEAWSFGPYRIAGIELQNSVDKWPAHADAVEAAITGAPGAIDVAYVDGLDVATHVKGYPAIGYLLWRDGDAAATAAAFDDPRCAYLTAASAAARAPVHAYRDGWSPSGGDYAAQLAEAGDGSAAYPSDQEAITAVVGGMLTALTAVAADKLGEPLGAASGGAPQPDAVEAAWSDTSLDDAANALTGVIAVYGEGPTSLAAYVRSREEDGRVDEAVVDALAGAIDGVRAIPGPLESAVTADPAAVQAAIDAVDRAQIAVTGDLSTLLGINPSAVEGDND